MDDESTEKSERKSNVVPFKKRMKVLGICYLIALIILWGVICKFDPRGIIGLYAFPLTFLFACDGLSDSLSEKFALTVGYIFYAINALMFMVCKTRSMRIVNIIILVLGFLMNLAGCSIAMNGLSKLCE